MAASDWEEEQEAASDSDTEPEEELADSELDEDPGNDEERGPGVGAASPTQQQLEEQRQQNIRALVSGTGLALRRQALLPRLLTVQQAAVVLRRPFKCPAPGAPAVSQVETAVGPPAGDSWERRPACLWVVGCMNCDQMLRI